MQDERIIRQHADLNEIGDIAVCAFCHFASASGEHYWHVEEDGPGAWVCEDEDACHVRLGVQRGDLPTLDEFCDWPSTLRRAFNAEFALTHGS